MNMKKSLIYILALSAIVGCQKSEEPEQIPAVTIPGMTGSKIFSKICKKCSLFKKPVI